MSDERMLVEFESDHGLVKLSEGIVRKYLVSGTGNPSDQEIVMFLKLCQYQKLNPFLKEAYLVKFGNQPATIITGKDVFTKRAAKSELFDGIESGVVVKMEDGKVDYRAGKLVLKGEELVGAWAKVYRKDWAHPVHSVVSYEEYVGRKSDGTVNSQWKRMPATMLEKVAKVQALRDAFPENFQGLYDAAEMGNASDAEPPKAEMKPDEQRVSKMLRPPQEDQPEVEEVVDGVFEVSEDESEPKEDGISKLRSEAMNLLSAIEDIALTNPEAQVMSPKQCQVMREQLGNLKGEGALRAMIKNLERQATAAKQEDM